MGAKVGQGLGAIDGLAVSPAPWLVVCFKGCFGLSANGESVLRTADGSSNAGCRLADGVGKLVGDGEVFGGHM